MKGKQSRRKHGFKAGHAPHYTGGGRLCEKEGNTYLRVSKEMYGLVSSKGPGVEAETNTVGETPNIRLLRPRVSQQSELETASEGVDER